MSISMHTPSTTAVPGKESNDSIHDWVGILGIVIALSVALAALYAAIKKRLDKSDYNDMVINYDEEEEVDTEYKHSAEYTNDYSDMYKTNFEGEYVHLSLHDNVVTITTSPAVSQDSDGKKGKKGKKIKKSSADVTTTPNEENGKKYEPPPFESVYEYGVVNAIYDDGISDIGRYTYT